MADTGHEVKLVQAACQERGFIWIASVLARGLCKSHATSANMQWYTATRDQLQKVVTPLAASSPKAAAEASAAVQA